jgi:hypothetical protein
MFKLIAFNRMYDRRHPSPQCNHSGDSDLCGCSRSPEHDDSAQIRTTRAQAAVVSTGITPMISLGSE